MTSQFTDPISSQFVYAAQDSSIGPNISCPLNSHRLYHTERFLEGLLLSLYGAGLAQPGHRPRYGFRYR
jgi:hypothetical protein